MSETTSRTWIVTAEGNAIDSSILVEKEIISEITPELLQSDSWRDAEFRRFDVTLDSAIPKKRVNLILCRL